MSFESMPSNDEHKQEGVQEGIEKWDQIKDVDLRKLDLDDAKEYLGSLTDEQIQRVVDFLDKNY